MSPTRRRLAALAFMLCCLAPTLLVGAQEDPYAPIFIDEKPAPKPQTKPVDDPYAPIFVDKVTADTAKTKSAVPQQEDRLTPKVAPPKRKKHDIPLRAEPKTIEHSKLELFLNSSFLWRDPIIVACIAAIVLGVMGVYVVLKRMVFVTATLANVSGVGVALGLLLGLGAAHGHEGAAIAWYSDLLGLFGFSLLITAITAGSFAWWRASKFISNESILGVAYLASSAALVLFASQLNQATHDIDNIVFGTAVVVEKSQLVIVPLFSIIILIINFIFNKDFIFSSFDPTTAQAVRYPVRLLNVSLLVLIGIAIAITTRAIGALPVFSFVVLPPLAALQLSERLRHVFILAPIFGLIAAAGGYVAAFMLAWPVGPTMTTACAALLLLSALARRILPNKA